MLETVLTAIVTVICSVLASSGFWAFMTKKSDSKNGEKDILKYQTEILIGLAHDRIVSLGMEYIKRGFITTEEYTNLVDKLYAPYEKAGGNGTAKLVIENVKKLTIKDGDDN